MITHVWIKIKDWYFGSTFDTLMILKGEKEDTRQTNCTTWKKNTSYISKENIWNCLKINFMLE